MLIQKARTQARTPRSSMAINSPSPWKCVADATWIVTSTRGPSGRMCPPDGRFRFGRVITCS